MGNVHPYSAFGCLIESHRTKSLPMPLFHKAPVLPTHLSHGRLYTPSVSDAEAQLWY
jgi:hypothetical protein